MNYRPLASGIALACAFMLFATRSIAQTYAVIDLGIPSGRPQALNDAGAIVGFYRSANTTRAFVHESAPAPGGTFIDLGMLPGMTQALARGINEAGQIVGSSFASTISSPGRAYLYTPGLGMQDLGVLGGGRMTSEAYCVDGFANVGGESDGTAFTPEAFLRPAGGPMRSVQPGTNGTVLHLSTSGWAVGKIGPNRAFYIPPGGTLTIVPLPAATPLGSANAVSEGGIVAGVMSDPSGSPSYGFRFDPSTGVLDNLGNISRFGNVTAIDSQGTVVGYQQTSSQTDPSALISTDGAPFRLVNTLLAPGSAWTIRTISGLNELGQMCGTAAPSGGGVAPVRLDPTGPPTNSIARSSIIGSPCGNAVLRASPPRIARPWERIVHSATPAQAGFFMLGLGAPPAVPFPGGCTLWVGAAPIIESFFATNAAGSWADTFTVPRLAGLAGLVFTTQAGLFGPAGANSIVLTNAARVVVGSR